MLEPLSTPGTHQQSRAKATNPSLNALVTFCHPCLVRFLTLLLRSSQFCNRVKASLLSLPRFASLPSTPQDASTELRQGKDKEQNAFPSLFSSFSNFASSFVSLLPPTQATRQHPLYASVRVSRAPAR